MRCGLIVCEAITAFGRVRSRFSRYSGWNEPEHKAHGLAFPPIDQRADLMEDQLAILHGLWGEADGWTFEGITGAPVLTDYGSTFGSGTATHNLTLYKAPSGARVFGAGTVQWAWGLDSNHDRGSVEGNLLAAVGRDVRPFELDL